MKCQEKQKNRSAISLLRESGWPRSRIWKRTQPRKERIWGKIAQSCSRCSLLFAFLIIPYKYCCHTISIKYYWFSRTAMWPTHLWMFSRIGHRNWIVVVPQLILSCNLPIMRCFSRKCDRLWEKRWGRTNIHNVTNKILVHIKMWTYIYSIFSFVTYLYLIILIRNMREKVRKDKDSCCNTYNTYSH